MPVEPPWQISVTAPLIVPPTDDVTKKAPNTVLVTAPQVPVTTQ